MIHGVRRLWAGILLSVAIVVCPAIVIADDALSAARDLYAAAAYEDALAALDRLRAGGVKIDENRAVDQYRAFCLLALGRSDDARKVIQQIVEANPAFQPSESQISPRLRDAFREVRRRVLPSILRQTYMEAKLAFDRKDFEIAGVRFELLMTLVADADVAGANDLADLRILSKGFLDLIKGMPQATQATPPPVAEPPTAAPAAAPARLPAPSSAPIYTSSDVDVTPPVAMSQAMPPWHPSRMETQTYQGTLILVIDEMGNVESISTQGQLQPAYVAGLRRAAANWKYQPATRNGVPVKYRKLVAVRLSPTD